MDPDLTKPWALPEEFLKRTFALINSDKDRNSASLVCKDWYNAERFSRRHVSIRNCYSVSPEIVAARFPGIRSVTLKGKPRFSDFNLVPEDWGADVQSWLSVFAAAYPFLEELRLKRMAVSDESLEYLAMNFHGFKALSLLSCDGFSTIGLEAINGIDDLGGDWLSYVPENLTSLEVLNFAALDSEVSFDALESLVSRCKSLRVLKVNRKISLDQLRRLIELAPKLTELGTGSFAEDLVSSSVTELESAFSKCRDLHTLSGFWDVTLLYLPVIFPVCGNLTFLNLSYATLGAIELECILTRCKSLRRLWVLDTVGDEGLEMVGSCCPLLEELRVFPADPFNQELGVTESGFLSVSNGCPNLHYVLYFCQRMTNAAVATVAQNCPNFTHFRLCIMSPGEPDYLTNEPMDEAFGAIVKTCPNLRRLSVSGRLTDLAFEYIGNHAKNLETFSVAFAGTSDLGMEYVMRGCPKLRRVEIRDCPFGDNALLSGLAQYESMRSLWMSACNVTTDGCKKLADEMPRLNVEVIKDDGGEDGSADKVYIYRTVAGPRTDAPPFVVTL
ncbi:Leucine-rich repeat, cysteine-containing subtype [Cynara cardunculus var. scolymus]|uniref:Leucine-rich repeat, cysteine-containing subtype n=1 Tax=Cynara cardunculus var. scolymus TaxID=59895 RepID=A0A103XF92_CYNCS|nr:Leucine-rich repeat, cysteine-containing subtype [Cynara cardunculus var. scolymus]